MEQVQGACLYQIKWADESTQIQEIQHMFGKLTKKRGLRQGDHVLALALPSTYSPYANLHTLLKHFFPFSSDAGVCMPGTVLDRVGQEIEVEFCDGHRYNGH